MEGESDSNINTSSRLQEESDMYQQEMANDNQVDQLEMEMDDDQNVNEFIEEMEAINEEEEDTHGGNGNAPLPERQTEPDQQKPNKRPSKSGSNAYR